MTNKEILLLKQNHFTDPQLVHQGYAYYTIRKNLMIAIDELKEVIGGTVVDVGCGIMPYREYLEERKTITNYIGIDIQQSNYHNKIKPDLFWDGETIPIEDNSCDWIIATEFLEHYQDTDAILKEMSRVLKKGGKLFFTVPCVWVLHEIPYDCHRFTPFSLKYHFERANFSKINIKALGGIDSSLAIMYGLWLDNSGIEGFNKRFFRKLFKPFFKFLIKRDNRNLNFNNSEMPSGLYGFIEK